MYHNHDLQNLVTPVNVLALEHLLEETEYDKTKSLKLINGFKNGFDLGYRGPQDVQLKSANLKFVVGDESVLWNKVMKEVQLKRLAGPFEQIPFENYIQSPIGLVSKDGGTKTRLIFHLSHPRCPKSKKKLSVNANIPKEMTSVKYADFTDAVILCMKCGKGCFAGKSDMTSAFRHLCIAKKFWKYLVLKAKHPISGVWFYFVDKCLPFGAAISCALFQDFSNCVVHIVSKKTGKSLINYLDDYFFVDMLELLCNNQIQQFLQICMTIRFPVALDKTFWATTRIVFLGLLIDTLAGLVSIPLNKIEKAVGLIRNFLRPGRSKVTLFEVQKLAGVLNFISTGVIPGRSFTRRLYKLTSKLTKSHHHMRINRVLRADLRVWLQFLAHPSAFARPFMDFSKVFSAEEIDLFTDASLNPDLGCGGHCAEEWFMIPWESDFILEKQPSIEYLELYAVTVGVLLWIHKFKNRRVALFCDNMSVVFMINKTTSHCTRCMVLIRLIVLQGLIHNVRIFAQHVSTKANLLADNLSRMKKQEFFSNALKTKHVNHDPTPVPAELWPLEKLWYER